MVETATATQAYLETLLDLAKAAPKHAEILGLGFIQVKDYWAEMHQWVKPAVDADTLHTPVPIIRFAEATVDALDSLKKTEILILLSPEFNYYLLGGNYLSETHSALWEAVKGVPDFPQDLALVGIPYSQANRLMPNLLIFHELGHHVFDRRQLRQVLVKKIENKLPGWLDGLDPPRPSVSTQILQWWSEILIVWSEEMFCDLFATAILGPAYTHAVVDHFEIIRLFDEGTSKRFGKTHPAPAFRIAEHAKLLEEMNWLTVVESIDLDLYKKMQTWRGLPSNDYVFIHNGIDVSGLLPTFWNLQHVVHDMVLKATENERASVEGFKKHNPGIKGCLKVGIVPSAVYSSDQQITPVSLLNAAVAFYADGFAQLVDNVENVEKVKKVGSAAVASIEDRSRVAESFESWVMKAIDDLDLIKKLPGN